MMKILKRIELFLLIILFVNSFKLKNTSSIESWENIFGDPEVTAPLVDVFYETGCQNINSMVDNVAYILYMIPDAKYNASFPTEFNITLCSAYDNSTLDYSRCIPSSTLMDEKYYAFSCTLKRESYQEVGNFYIKKEQVDYGRNLMLDKFLAYDKLFGVINDKVNKLQGVLSVHELYVTKDYRYDIIDLYFESDLTEVPEEAFLKTTAMDCSISKANRKRLRCNTNVDSLTEGERGFGSISTVCPTVYSRFVVKLVNESFYSISQFSEKYESEGKCGNFEHSDPIISVTLNYELLGGTKPDPLSLTQTCLFLKSGEKDLRINCTEESSKENSQTFPIYCKFHKPSNAVANYRLAVETNCFYNNGSFLLKPFEINSFVGYTQDYIEVSYINTSIKVDYTSTDSKDIQINYVSDLNSSKLPYIVVEGDEGQIKIDNCVASGKTLVCTFTKELLPPNLYDRKNYKTYSGDLYNICDQPEKSLTISVCDTNPNLPYIKITGGYFLEYCNYFNGTNDAVLYLSYTGSYSGVIKELVIGLMKETTTNEKESECKCNKDVESLPELYYICLCKPTSTGIYYPVLKADYYQSTYIVQSFELPTVKANFTRVVNPKVIAPLEGDVIVPTVRFDGDEGNFSITFEKAIDRQRFPNVSFGEYKYIKCNVSEKDAEKNMLICKVHKSDFEPSYWPYNGTFYDMCDRETHKIQLYSKEISRIVLTYVSITGGESNSCTTLRRGTTFYLGNSAARHFTSLGTIAAEAQGFGLVDNTYYTVVPLSCTLILSIFTCSTTQDAQYEGYYTFHLFKEYKFIDDTVYFTQEDNTAAFGTFVIYYSLSALAMVNSYIGSSFVYDYKNGLMGRFAIVFNKNMPSSYVPVVKVSTGISTDQNVTLRCEGEEKYLQCLFGADQVLAEKAFYYVYINDLCGGETTAFYLEIINTGPPIVLLNEVTFDNYGYDCTNIRVMNIFRFDNFTNKQVFSSSSSESVNAIILKPVDEGIDVRIPTQCYIKESTFKCEVRQNIGKEEYVNGNYKVVLENDYFVRQKAVIYRYESKEEIIVNNNYAPLNRLISPASHDYGTSAIGTFKVQFTDIPSTEIGIYLSSTNFRFPCSPVGNDLICKFVSDILMPGVTHIVKVVNPCGVDEGVDINVVVTQSRLSPDIGVYLTNATFTEKCIQYTDGISFYIGIMTTLAIPTVDLDSTSLMKDSNTQIATDCHYSSSYPSYGFRCTVKPGQEFKYEGFYNAYVREQRIAGYNYSIPTYTSYSRVYLSKKAHIAVNKYSYPSDFKQIDYDYKDGSAGTFEIDMIADVGKNVPTVTFGPQRLSCSGKGSKVKCTFYESDFPLNKTKKADTIYKGALINVCGMKELDLALNLTHSEGTKKLNTSQLAGLIAGQIIVILLICGLFAFGILKCKRKNPSNPFKNIDVGVINDVSNSENYFLK